MTDNGQYPVIILGLDGATFDLMIPWMKEGRLPRLAKLLEEGAWSPLESTIPPITPCAWSSFMTGKNPGKHGLFDFVEPVDGGTSFRFTNASCRHAQTIWGYLSANGRRVAVMNVPMTYPPEQVNGYMISGLDTPDERSPFMYPPQLRKDLAAAHISYQLDPRHLGNMRTDQRRIHWLRELCDIERIRAEALKHLHQLYQPDCTMLVFTATDQVQHHFWHYMDPNHDKYDAKGAKNFGTAIRQVYETMDELIGSILDAVGKDAVVIIMSDHGFGPVKNVRIRINQALEQAGLLAFASEGTSRRATRFVAGAIDRVLRSTLSPAAKRWIASLLPRFRVWFESVDEAKIDWSRTAAATNEVMRCFPTVWLKHGTDRLACPAGELSQAEALQVVERMLRELKDPASGRPAISEVYRARDIYHGPFTDQSPDLLPSWWLDGFLLEQSVPGGPANRVVERSTSPVEGGVEFAGSHRMDGVFIMSGGPTRRGEAFRGARIIDVAPTILHVMGQPIPDDMDGRALTEALDPAFLAAHPLRFTGGSEQAPPTSHDAPFTKEEEELVAQRLRSIGYIE